MRSTATLLLHRHSPRLTLDDQAQDFLQKRQRATQQYNLFPFPRTVSSLPLATSLLLSRVPVPVRRCKEDLAMTPLGSRSRIRDTDLSSLSIKHSRSSATFTSSSLRIGLPRSEQPSLPQKSSSARLGFRIEVRVTSLSSMVASRCSTGSFRTYCIMDIGPCGLYNPDDHHSTASQVAKYHCRMREMTGRPWTIIVPFLRHAASKTNYRATVGIEG